MAEFKGAWPGGPSRRDADEEDPREARERERIRGDLRSLEEQSVRAVAVGKRRRAERRRRIHVRLAIAAAVVAGIGGYFLGLQSHTSTEELSARRMEATERSGVEDVVTRETSRVIQQMWLAELMERTPR